MVPIGTLLLGALVILPVAYAASGPAGLFAALWATALCLMSGTLSLLASTAVSRASTPLGGLLVGIMVRMALPLAVVMAIYHRGGWLVAAGMIYYVLVFYMITLAAETWIAVGQVGGVASASRGEHAHG